MVRQLALGMMPIQQGFSGYVPRQMKESHKALLLLLSSPYSSGTNGTKSSSIIAARPAMNVKKSGQNAGFAIPYSPLLLHKVQRLLLKDSKLLKSSKPYRFDIVDVQRQIMTNLANWELSFVNQYNKNRTPMVKGDEIQITISMFDKYSQLSKEYYEPNIKKDGVENENRFENLGE